jgi:trk system potassium uptake protein TrkA
MFEEKHHGEVVKVQHIIGVPRGNTVLYDTDVMIIMGKTHDVDKFIEINR